MKTDFEKAAIPRITTVAEFFAQALAIEEEATERYEMLADTMEVHNNREIAEIFRKMAVIEGHHREEIARRAGDRLVGGMPATFDWTMPEGPEAVAFEDLHYLMSPHQALLLARHNEVRAAAFFKTIAETVTDGEIREIAEEMARDEEQHVIWVDQWLTKFPETGPRPEDPDPPVYSE